MDSNKTNQKLASLTDAGAFERLATAVLRQADPRCKTLVHPGVNEEGKTVKSPVDCITFVPGASPVHMIVVHHTTADRDDLEKKWLQDPVKVKRRSKISRTAQPGDCIKTATLVASERARTPDLQVTLILTTNRDPSEKLVRDVETFARSAGITVDIWARSRIAHYLDVDPDGQWLRELHLGISQERLSREKLLQLSEKSIESMRPPGNANTWIERQLDRDLKERAHQKVVFVVAESGFGKSVACYKHLAWHIKRGHAGIVLSADIVAQALSFEQAIEIALSSIHPKLLPGSGMTALDLCSPSEPLVAVIEDINKSANPQGLVEKILGWSRAGSGREIALPWQILCPVWPRALSSLSDEAHKQVEPMLLYASTYTPTESAIVVKQRATESGIHLSDLDAARLSTALGHDPLLIALHDAEHTPEPGIVIVRYITNSVRRTAAAPGGLTSQEYQDALRQLGREMLRHKMLQPIWKHLTNVFGLSDAAKNALRDLARSSEVIRTVKYGENEEIAFRHDRVRDALLVDAAKDLMTPQRFPKSGLDDPFFAEIVGAIFAEHDKPPGVMSQVVTMNPLALFSALSRFREPRTEGHRAVVTALDTWLSLPSTSQLATLHLRWHAEQILANTDSSLTRKIIDRLPATGSWFADRARFRNGDFPAGLTLCWRLEPGVNAVGHRELIKHVQASRQLELRAFLDRLLRDADAPEQHKVSALRLAGHLADANLADAVAQSWSQSRDKENLISEYLWAAVNCCGTDAAYLLDPICVAWAQLPDSDPSLTHGRTPRSAVVDGSFRFAFRGTAREPAIRFFVERARLENRLSWHIIWLLHGVDHPDAVEFVAREIAATNKSLEGTDQFYPFGLTADQDWERMQRDNGTPMSLASRSRLHVLWADKSNDAHLRRAALKLWAATILEGDIDALRAINTSDELFPKILFHRAKRRDRDSIPALVAMLDTEEDGYWWQTGRYIWSDELCAALDRKLKRRANKKIGKEKFTDGGDWIVSELLMTIPVNVAEALLVRHWESLKFTSYFVQAALYLATPTSLQLAERSMSECHAPETLLKHLSYHWGIKTTGRRGLTRKSQIEALAPYLDHLDESSIGMLWEACNERQWYESRTKYLDGRLGANSRDLTFTSDERMLAELRQMSEAERPTPIDYWIERAQAAGISLDRVFRLLGELVRINPSINALELAAKALTCAGRRSHLAQFRGLPIEPLDQAAAILSNAEFAVFRRSLS